MTDFIARLKQRKLVQWALAYVAAAFALLQGIDIFAQRFDWPGLIERGVLIAVCIGFFAVLVIAWYHGERGAQKVSGTELLLLALLLAIGGGLLWKFAPGGAGTASVASAGDRARQSVSADRHSIAVLPFVNMSGDKNNEYFSDGVSEEILNVLAEIPQLKVAARTSSFSFKGSKDSVPQIARLLGVRMVLEGSVRKQGDRVRITAQLIDARTGYDLWSQNYDRELKDIFAVQDEIARSVGEELKLRMVGKGKVDHRGTQNVQAYDLYLRGLSLWQERTEDSLWSAKDTFEKAIAKDPKFAQAWGGLALVYAVLPEYTAKISHEQAMALGRKAAERALVLDPTMPEPYAALGQFERYAQHQDTALALTERALALRPSFATAHHWLGTILVPSGEIERGLAASRRATELDPRSVVDASNYASMLMIAGRNADAIAACKPTLEYAPDSVLCYPIIGMAYLVQGDLKQARHYYHLFVAHWNPKESGEVDALFDALAGRGDRQVIAVQLSNVTTDVWNDPNSGMPFSNLDIPPMLVLLGDKELVYQFIARQEPGTFSTLAWTLLMPVMDPVRCDPRFQGPLKKAGLRDLRAEKICKAKK